MNPANSTNNIINTLVDPELKNIPDMEIKNDIVESLLQNENDYDLYHQPGKSNFNMNNELHRAESHEGSGIQTEKLVLNYETNAILFALSFHNFSDSCKLAIGSLEKSLDNRIEIIEMKDDVLSRVCLEQQEFPSTKLMWSPSYANSNTLASSSDVIRLYNYTDEDKRLYLNQTLQNKKSKYCAPLTSFDWNRENNSILGTASIDTTCTIWDLNKSTIRTQLIAHDKEVFDIAFSDNNEHIFISAGADGSIRLFDLRSLDHSTIIYESKDQTPITKIAWNTQNHLFISALAWEKDTVYIIDTRRAMMSLVELKSHNEPVTGMAWAPLSDVHICSVGQDKNALIWNINNQIENSSSRPYLSYSAPEGINNVSWCNYHHEWIGIVFKNQIQLLRV
jgi:WD repeat-containing protein 68